MNVHNHFVAREYAFCFKIKCLSEKSLGFYNLVLNTVYKDLRLDDCAQEENNHNAWFEIIANQY